MRRPPPTVLIWLGVIVVIALGATIAAVVAGDDESAVPTAASTTVPPPTTGPTTDPPATTLASATTTTVAPPPTACTDQDCADGSVPIDYLIVTRPIFVDALSPFIEWKTAQGFSIGLVTVDWLDATFEGSHVAERMKTGMHHIRTISGTTETIYALLVGDTVTARDDFSIDAMLASYDLTDPWNTPTGYYRRIDNDPEGTILPSDAYFTDETDWDIDGTGLNAVGGPNGQGRFLARILLGRWSVRSPEEIRPLIDKTMSVAPARSVFVTLDQDFHDNPNDCCTEWPPNDEPFGYGTKACCYLNNDTTIERVLGDNAPWLTTETLFVDLSVDDDAPLQRFLATDSAVMFTYHGLYECVAMTHGRCVTADEMLFESTFSLLEASACYIAAFYAGDGDTLAEAILKRPTGPAVVVQPGHNSYGFWERAVTGVPVGEAFWDAADDYVYWLNPMLLLGDPSLVVIAGPDGA